MFKGLSVRSRAAPTKVEADALQAAAENRAEVLERLLANAGGVGFVADHVRDANRRTLLHVAAFEGSGDALALLLRSRGLVRKIDARDRTRRTALHLAAAIGDDMCVRKLANANAALDLQDEWGCTPLHLAIKFEQVDAVRVLLEINSDPMMEDMKGDNAVDMAHTVKDQQVAPLLMSFSPRKRPSALRQLRKCLLPMYTPGGNARRAKAYAEGEEEEAEAADLTEETLPRPLPIMHAVQAPPSAAKLAEDAHCSSASRATENHDAAVERAGPDIINLADGDSDCAAHDEGPPRAAAREAAAPAAAAAERSSQQQGNDDRTNDWYFMDDDSGASAGQDRLSAAIAEAAREQAMHEHIAPCYFEPRRSGEEEQEVPPGPPQAQESEEMRVEWHGLEPVYVRGPKAAAPPAAAAAPALLPQEKGAGGTFTTDDLLAAYAAASAATAAAAATAGVEGGGTNSSASTALGQHTRSSSCPPASEEQVQALPGRTALVPQDGVSAATSGPDELPAPCSSGSTPHFGIDGGGCTSGGGGPSEAEDEGHTILVELEEDAEMGLPEPEAIEDFHVFSMQMLFGEDVERLEFEVDWQDQQPAVGAVKPGGEAERRGIVRGDRILECNGMDTAGKAREELLPFLKVRPLAIQIGRLQRVLDPRRPCAELELAIGGNSDDQGLDITWSGCMPVVGAVRVLSAAWAAGVLQGDGIAAVNGREAVGMPCGDLRSALQGRPLNLSLQRRPLGTDPAAPWPPATAHKQGGHPERWDSDEDSTPR